MALKIDVNDRVPTYPGRVTLTPVEGLNHTYDMLRADEPLVDGTPINKELFDNKAYTLVEDSIVYVASTGDDEIGDGSVEAPFKTIQRAIDAIPKHLGGHTAEISIGSGIYAERITVDGFTSGRLVIGTSDEVFIINGIDIINSSFVETNIYQIEKATGSTKSLFVATEGSNVLVNRNMILDGISADVMGMVAERGSRIATGTGVTITVNNCNATIVAQLCSHVSVDNATGDGNIMGMWANQGSVVSYKSDSTLKMWSNVADSGGLVLTGQNSSDLSDATLDL